MSLAVGPYGIEYDPRQRDSGSPGIRKLIIFILVVAAISLFASLIRRAFVSSPKEDVQVHLEKGEAIIKKEVVHEQPVRETMQREIVTAEVPKERVVDKTLESRPARVRNLLMRLEEAEKRCDTVMAVTTIEQICSLPGDPAHDLYDKLYKRAGELNIKWLFDEKNAQWVSDVVVKAGDSATRLARRNGSTLASFAKLNPTKNIESLKIGDTVKVMTRPRFNLIIHRRARTAEIKLNGKFFKRYDLKEAVTGDVGAYETKSQFRQQLAEKGIWFDKVDRAEVETLVPQGSLLIISEL